MNTILSGIRSVALPFAQRALTAPSAKAPASDPTPKPVQTVGATAESLSAAFASVDQAVTAGDIDALRSSFLNLQDQLKSYYHMPLPSFQRVNGGQQTYGATSTTGINISA